MCTCLYERAWRLDTVLTLNTQFVQNFDTTLQNLETLWTPIHEWTWRHLRTVFTHIKKPVDDCPEHKFMDQQQDLFVYKYTHSPRQELLKCTIERQINSPKVPSEHRSLHTLFLYMLNKCTNLANFQQHVHKLMYNLSSWFFQPWANSTFMKLSSFTSSWLLTCKLQHEFKQSLMFKIWNMNNL